MDPIKLTSADVNQLLNQVIATAYTEKRPALESVNFIPLGSQLEAGAETVSYDLITEIGMAKIIDDYAKDLPPVAIQRTTKYAPVKTFGDSYSYSYVDLLRAKKSGIALESVKASTARFGIEAGLDKFALVGLKEAGVTGLFNNENVPVVSLGSNWLTADGDKIVADFQKLFDAVEEATNGTETPNAVIIPAKVYGALNTRRMSSTNETRILQYLKDVFPQVTSWERSRGLNDVGTNGASRVVLYTKDVTAVSRRNAVNFTQLAEQWSGIAATVNCLARSAGTIFHRPLSAVYGDKVGGES